MGSYLQGMGMVRQFRANLMKEKGRGSRIQPWDTHHLKDRDRNILKCTHDPSCCDLACFFLSLILSSGLV